jgi:hypothetical protein
MDPEGSLYFLLAPILNQIKTVHTTPIFLSFQDPS